ncbi:porin family protein [Phenylobacterium sp.]|uniref:outer membrane protein n=1 Tax=Phenylobacterium sp. TaxID=1871053 RepID=UPI0028A2A2A7|nr:porin family protein [Phenylobacterium sp.]
MTLKFLLTAAGCASLLAPASAMAQDFYDWTGFYIGGNLGASWGDTSIKTKVEPGNGTTPIDPRDVAALNAATSDDDNDTGFTGGIQGGYNYQSGNWVFGLETDVGWMDIGQSRSNTYALPSILNPPIAATISQEVSTDWVWTLRPRIGYASGPYMIYGTAGLAVSKVQVKASYADNRTIANNASFSDKDTKTGWAAGLGGAYAVSDNMSARAEWLYTDFGDVRASWVTPNGYAAFTTEGDTRANLLRIGLDYKF